MASIVEWQSMHMQEYRFALLVNISNFFDLFGIYRPVTSPHPFPAGDYDHALHVDHPEALSLLQQYLDSKPSEPKLGGAPRQTAPGDEEGEEEY